MPTVTYRCVQMAIVSICIGTFEIGIIELGNGTMAVWFAADDLAALIKKRKGNRRTEQRESKIK